MRRDAAEASARLLDEAEYLLLTIHLPDGNAYATSAPQDVVSRGRTYLAGIAIGRPQDDGQPAAISVTVPHRGNRLANLISIAADTVAMTLERVADTDPDTVIETYSGLVLRSATVALGTAELALKQDIPIDEPVSGLRATAANFPGVEYDW